MIKLNQLSQIIYKIYANDADRDLDFDLVRPLEWLREDDLRRLESLSREEGLSRLDSPLAESSGNIYD
ncbi:LOW QUALITY PROTEIN: hypothetical protein HZS_325 [Henneguya salminicola]|nr:LOW QUALITY PROTEIN: hypothetical protein HZS_325 [Henneguya salminicola]